MGSFAANDRPLDPSPAGAQRSDSELLAAHVDGDRYAFEELFYLFRTKDDWLSQRW